MRVLHVPFTFYPDAIGGTEVYVATLVDALKRRGIEGAVAAPAESSHDYRHGETEVYRFAVGNPTLPEQYGDGDPVAAAAFETICDEYQPDVVHLHAHTSAVSRRLAAAAKARGCKVVLTYHTPTVSCARGTMMHLGATPCDGRLNRTRCTTCTAHAQGMNPLAAQVIGAVPPALGAAVAQRNRSGGIWTALQLSHLIERKHDAVESLIQMADRVVAVCKWIWDVLEINQVHMGKVVLSRQGLPYWDGQATTPPPAQVRLAYVGRLDSVKGVEVIIEAMRRQPKSVDVTLDIYGMAQGITGTTYQHYLSEMAADEPRIRFCATVPADAIVPLLRGYSALLVPSIWLETGPLVVLEAFAAGIPVLGSRRGGIAELVTDGQDGWLLPPHEPNAWATAITRFATHAPTRHQLRQGVRPPRTVEQVADEMAMLYRELGVS